MTTVAITNMTGQTQVLSCVDGSVKFAPGVRTEIDASLLSRSGLRQPNMEVSVEGAARPSPNRPLPLIVSGALSRSDGYSAAFENLWCNIRDDNRFDPQLYNVWILNIPGLFNRTLMDLDKFKTIEPTMVGFMIAPPRYYTCLPSEKKIGCTMYETDDLLLWHPDWPDQCKCLDVLVVPHEWQVPYFAEQVYSGPIRVIPLLLSPEIEYMHRPARADSFTVGTWGVLTSRKGAQEAIDAFRLAFPSRTFPDCRLMLKTKVGVLCHPDKPELHDDWRIQVIDDIWDESQMLRFMYALDCGVFLSRGEGFGMPARESIVSGLPTIVHTVTGYGDLGQDVCLTVGTDHVEKSFMGGTWPIACVRDAAAHMRWVYENRTAALTVASDASVIMADRCRSDVVLDALYDLCLEVARA